MTRSLRPAIVRALTILIVAVAAAFFSPGVARAADDVSKQAKAEAERVTGVDKKEHLPSDAGRDFGNALLFVPRKVTEFMLWSSTVAIGVLEKEPVVPRAQEAVSTGGGHVVFVPTAFFETKGVFNVGARMITDFDWVATGLRVGVGGANSFEIEPRITVQPNRPLRTLISAEALYRRDNDSGYFGVGQVPATDPRNHFRPGHAGEEARYFEERTRFIFSYAVRLSDNLELLTSGSLDRRRITDPRGVDKLKMSQVFVKGSVPGSFDDRALVYGEAALRLDSRRTRGRPSGGLLVEGYGGTARSVLSTTPAEFLRLGGRAAGFIPLYRKTNILSPRVVLEGVVPINHTEIPFTELAGEPDFRGYDERRDRIATVMSLDYRWLIVEHVATSIFMDATTVGAGFDQMQFKHLRWVVGAAIDLHRDEAVLGRFSIAAGIEGPRFLFTLGNANDYGDRQHRD